MLLSFRKESRKKRKKKPKRNGKCYFLFSSHVKHTFKHFQNEKGVDACRSQLDTHILAYWIKLFRRHFYFLFFAKRKKKERRLNKKELKRKLFSKLRSLLHWQNPTSISMKVEDEEEKKRWNIWKINSINYAIRWIWQTRIVKIYLFDAVRFVYCCWIFSLHVLRL